MKWLLFLCFAFQLSAQKVECFFSPPGCEAAVVARIATATKTIRCQAYSFTDTPIASALVAAQKRGVNVQVIMDAKEAVATNLKVIGILKAAGIPVYLDAMHAIAHNKVIEADQKWVVTGSFNFTFAAEHRNAENIVIITDAATALTFEANWNNHLAHSKLSP